MSKFKVGDRVRLVVDVYRMPRGSTGTVSCVTSRFTYVYFDEDGSTGGYDHYELELVPEGPLFGYDKNQFTEEQLKELGEIVAEKVAEFAKKNEPKVETVTLYSINGIGFGIFSHHEDKYKISVKKVNGEFDWSTLKGENL